jgi:hypothetical protein
MKPIDIHSHKRKNMKFTRRQILKSSVALTAGLGFPGFIRGGTFTARPAIPANDRIPEKGEEFNESFVFPDECTNKPIRRLTSKRAFNQKATYHIKSGFLGNYLVFSTYNDHEGGSALIRAHAGSGDLKVLDHTESGSDHHFLGSGTVVPKTSFFAYTAGDRILLYDIFTSEKREYPLVSGRNDVGYNWGGAAATCDGKYLLIPYNSNRLDWNDPPEIRNKRVGNSLFALDLESGILTEVHRDEHSRNNHVIANPVDPEYCLIDKDLPPHFYGRGDNGKTSRVWTLHIPTGKLTEIRPNDGCRFAYHSNWNHDGTHVYYHGPSNEQSLRENIEQQGIQDFMSPYGECNPKFSAECNPHFIGVADRHGKVVWEGVFPSMYYGHSAAHMTKDVLFIDNLVTNRYVLGLHWRELNRWGMPRIEMVLAHNSIYVDGLQASHPHCTMSDDGRWLSYNAYMHGRSDVYVAEME